MIRFFPKPHSPIPRRMKFNYNTNFPRINLCSVFFVAFFDPKWDHSAQTSKQMQGRSMSSFFHLAPIYHPKYDKTHPEPCQSMLNKVKVAFKFFDYYLSFKDTDIIGTCTVLFVYAAAVVVVILAVFFLPECIWVGEKPTHK